MRDSESWNIPPSVQFLSSQIIRIIKISSVHESLENAKVQKEETRLKMGIVLSLKTVNPLWSLSLPTLTLDKLWQLKQHWYTHRSAKECT